MVVVELPVMEMEKMVLAVVVAKNKQNYVLKN
jgi:hypothetical protein